MQMLSADVLVAGIAAIAVSISAPSSLRAQPTALSTGQIHEVQINSAPDEGLEAHIPPNSWYAKGISFDATEDWARSYDAYLSAIREFEALVKNGVTKNAGRDLTQQRKMVRGWLLKAKQQRNISSFLKHRLRIGFRSAPPGDCYLAPYFHDKWLAIRAYAGHASPGLATKTLQRYRSCLIRRPQRASARLGLAAMLNELGRYADARRQFSSVANLKLWSLSGDIAYYYASAGSMSLALSYLAKGLRNSSHNRQKALISNRFDRLRVFPQFLRLVGSP